MQKFNDVIQDGKGNAVTTASIYVYLANTGTLAALKKDDETTVLSNPITSADTDNYDSDGNYGFKAENGVYDIKVVIGVEEKWKEETLFDPEDADIAQNNLSASSAPTVNDDNTAGYSKSSLWIDTVASPAEAYRCLDASTGAAVWIKTTLSTDELGALALLNTAPIANGGTGQTSAQAAIDALTQVSSATNEHVLTKDAASGNAKWKPSVGASLSSGTAASTTSGTSIDFTGLPSTVKRVYVAFNEVGTNGSDRLMVQIGDSGGIDVTGYTGQATRQASTSNPYSSMSVGFFLNQQFSSTDQLSGGIMISNITGNTWICEGLTTNTNATGGVTIIVGRKTLTSTLDRIRLTTENGTDSFDSGAYNIFYE